MELPKNEAVFTFEHTGIVTGIKYEGSFTVLCILNMRQKHQLEVEKTKLLMDYLTPTDGLSMIAVLLANLRVRIVEGPDWWKSSNGGLTILDEDMLLALFNKLLDAEDKWRERKEEERISDNPRDASSTSESKSVIDNIQELAKKRSRAPLDDEETLLLYLRSWWSRTYNRPLKDPLLADYSLEELLYEFYDRIERIEADKERVEHLSDKMEDDRLKDTIDWAEQEEKRELEAARAKNKAPEPSEEDKKWMEEVVKKELEKAKENFGESFGEDIDEKF